MKINTLERKIDTIVKSEKILVYTGIINVL